MTYFNNFEVQVQEIEYYLEIEKFTQAKKAIEKLLPETPDNGLLLYYYAFCLYCLEENEVAEEALFESIRLGFRNVDSTYLLGRIRLQCNNFQSAEEAFLEALEMDPQSVPVMSSYALLMFRTGHQKKALNILDQALRLDPSNEVALSVRFIYLLAYGSKNIQLEMLADTLQGAGTETRKLLNIGLYELHHNKLKDAKEAFRQAYLQDPTNTDLLEALDELQMRTSLLFLPNNIIQKLGGPAFFWICTAFIALIGKLFLPDMIAGVLLLILVCLMLATWVSPVIYLAIKRKQARRKRTMLKQLHPRGGRK